MSISLNKRAPLSISDDSIHRNKRQRTSKSSSHTMTLRPRTSKPSSTRRTLTDRKVTKGCLREVELKSRALEGNPEGNSSIRKFFIYTPPGYEDNSSKRYPVLYLLHGSGTTHRLWTGKGYLKINIKTILDGMMLRKKIKPFIVAMPNGYTKSKGCWYSNSAHTGNWEDYIIKDVMGFVDQNYRTILESSGRAISGHSMGGYGAMKLALQHQDKFCAVYSMSGILTLETAFLKSGRTKFLDASAKAWSSDQQLPWKNITRIEDGKVVRFRVPDSEKWQEWAAHEPIRFVESGTQMIIRFDCGDKDQLCQANRDFSSALRERNIEHVFDEFSGGHGNRTVSHLQNYVLPFISEQFS